MLPVGSDEVLVLTVQAQWQDYIALTISQLPNLDAVLGNE
jgi:hypothetical protein